MEFEQTSETEQSIDNDTNAAQLGTRDLILAPVHADIKADDIPDGQIAAQHALGPAIANLPSDTESTYDIEEKTLSSSSPSRAHPAHRTALFTSTATAALLAAVTAFIVLKR